MSLFIATGTNLGDRKRNLDLALQHLQKEFLLIASSQIYESSAVDYLNQPDFYNQVLEFETPALEPHLIFLELQKIESLMGRVRNIDKGPRIIDLDILFIDKLSIQNDNLIVPHPRLFERSFVVFPLSELPGFSELKKTYEFNTTFNNVARPITN